LPIDVMQSVITLATPILDDPFVCRTAVLLVGEIAKGRAKLPTVDETDKYIPLDAVPHIAGIQGGGRSVVYSGGVEFLVAALHQNVASGELDTLYFSMSALIWVSGTDPNGMRTPLHQSQMCCGRAGSMTMSHGTTAPCSSRMSPIRQAWRALARNSERLSGCLMD
jgi:hypothetical protein